MSIYRANKPSQIPNIIANPLSNLNFDYGRSEFEYAALIMTVYMKSRINALLFCCFVVIVSILFSINFVECIDISILGMHRIITFAIYCFQYT